MYYLTSGLVAEYVLYQRNYCYCLLGVLKRDKNALLLLFVVDGGGFFYQLYWQDIIVDFYRFFLTWQAGVKTIRDSSDKA